jgi:hypothetical protein
MTAADGFANVEALQEPAPGARGAVAVAPSRVLSLGLLGRSKSTLSGLSQVTAEEDSEEDESLLSELMPLRTGKKIKRKKVRKLLCLDCEDVFCVLFYLVLLTTMLGLMYLKLNSLKSGYESV